jgi:hypothetical protein
MRPKFLAYGSGCSQDSMLGTAEFRCIGSSGGGRPAVAPPAPARPTACGVGAGPYGRAGRTARRSTAAAVGALQHCRQARATAAPPGRRAAG